MSSLRASYTHDDGEHVAQFAVWHGSESQIMSLLGAVEHNCDCAQGRGGGDNGRSRCAAHVMLAFDQRALDGLLFMRGIVDRLRQEEGLSRAASSVLLMSEI